jgi:hypothetical protein
VCEQEPSAQTSLVQGLPSSAQGAVLFTFSQLPVAMLQESSVHSLLSSQLRGEPTQVPAEQWSLSVQPLPSLQVAVLFVFTQPVALLHESLVQIFPSLQLSGAPAWQVPPEHESPVVHALPSLQGALLFV